MGEFWQVVWILIFVQMAFGVWLTFALYPGTSSADDTKASTGR